MAQADVTGAQPPQSTQTREKVSPIIPDHMNSQRVFKKSAPNNKLTIYLGTRDLIVSDHKIDPLYGVLLVDPDYVQDRKVFSQVTLTFRYGREDEEVMGLKFCNEAIMCLEQLYPVDPNHKLKTSPLQEALLKRLGPNAVPFQLEVNSLAPPSVQIVPAKEYSGAPIGTSYDVRAYVGDRPEEKPHRRSTVRMGIRVVQRASTQVSSPQPPHAAVEKPFILSDGRVELEASLDKERYAHGEMINVNVCITNNSNRTIRRVKMFVVQHVDVCMFSNGKFKNMVASLSSNEDCPVSPGATLRRTYCLKPAKVPTKNWIALEDSYSKQGASLASTVIRHPDDERNVFAIYVSYYVKVKLITSAIGGDVSLKIPFTLMNNNEDELDATEIEMNIIDDISKPECDLSARNQVGDSADAANPAQPEASNALSGENNKTGTGDKRIASTDDDDDEDAIKYVFEDFAPLSSS